MSSVARDQKNLASRRRAFRIPGLHFYLKCSVFGFNLFIEDLDNPRTI